MYAIVMIYMRACITAKRRISIKRGESMLRLDPYAEVVSTICPHRADIAAGSVGNAPMAGIFGRSWRV